MATKFQKYPVFKYDEPAILENFIGGINTDPANENISVSEMKNALNMHYSQTILKSRPGANKIATLIHNTALEKIQGIFFLGVATPTIIIAANGRLYVGLYEENITLTELKIKTDRAPLSYSDPYNQYTGLLTYTDELEDVEHNGYLYNNGSEIVMIFQNKRKIEAAAYNEKLYIATGTRVVVVFYENDVIVARPLQPFAPGGIELIELGQNLMSPFPNYCIRKQDFDGVKTQIHGVAVTQTGTNVYIAEAIMTFQDGRLPQDYLFKWELIDQNNNAYPLELLDANHYLLVFNSEVIDGRRLTQALIQVQLTKLQAENYRVRCSFAGAFKKDDNGALMTETISVVGGTYEDLIVDTLTDQWYGQATSFPPLHGDTAYNESWKQIQSCTKILSDGNKFILYDDDYNSGSWWKTIIDNPAYIVQRGSLCFKTDKNERLMRVIQYKGVMLAFAYNEISGGNIALVSGNGDDIKTDEYNYSPYARKVVNTNVTTDNAYSVQAAANMILFKYKNSVYMIEGSELNNEIVAVVCVNDKVKLRSPDVYIPWDDNDCVSEITDDFYALIWPEKLTLENGEIEVDRPATRAKMYYKNPMTDENRLFLSFPWLWDQSKTFNISDIFYIAGVSTHLYENALIQYTPGIWKDLNKVFPCVIRLKPSDLNYPKIVKFAQSLILFYYRGSREECHVTIKIFNEGGFKLYEREEHNLEDFKVLHDGDKEEGNLRLDSAIVNTKVFNFPYAFPALLIDVQVTIESGDEFALASMTFTYTTAETPDSTMFSNYSKLVRADGKLTIKPSLPVKITVAPGDLTIIGGGGAGDFQDGE